MISTAKCRVSSAKGFDYIQQQGRATEIARNDLVGQSPEQLNREFNQLAENKPNLKNNQINIIISPDAEQKAFSDSELKDILEQHLKNIGLENHPYIATVHRNTANPHIHCLVARVDRFNNVYKDNYISLKSQESAQKISQSLGLYNPHEKTKGLRAEIGSKIRNAVHECTSIQDLNKILAKDHISIEPIYKTKSKDIQGFRVNIKGKPSIKLSQIDRKLPKELSQVLSHNRTIVNDARKYLSDKSFVAKLPSSITKGLDLTNASFPHLSVSLAKSIVKFTAKTIFNEAGHSIGY